MTTLSLNHIMIYSIDVPRALAFYRDTLGFEVIETWGGGYARLKCPGSNGSIGLHQLEKGKTMDPSVQGLRIYLEVDGLDEFCSWLSEAGVKFDKMPADMPWGWRHAYLRDPDGHELSLYWAGDKRLQKTTSMSR